jgi:hypothetical protein
MLCNALYASLFLVWEFFIACDFQVLCVVIFVLLKIYVILNVAHAHLRYRRSSTAFRHVHIPRSMMQESVPNGLLKPSMPPLKPLYLHFVV